VQYSVSQNHFLSCPEEDVGQNHVPEGESIPRLLIVVQNSFLTGGLLLRIITGQAATILTAGQ
jgi:hypothetical protein